MKTKAKVDHSGYSVVFSITDDVDMDDVDRLASAYDYLESIDHGNKMEFLFRTKKDASEFLDEVQDIDGVTGGTVEFLDDMGIGDLWPGKSMRTKTSSAFDDAWSELIDFANDNPGVGLMLSEASRLQSFYKWPSNLTPDEQEEMRSDLIVELDRLIDGRTRAGGDDELVSLLENMKSAVEDEEMERPDDEPMSARRAGAMRMKSLAYEVILKIGLNRTDEALDGLDELFSLYGNEVWDGPRDCAVYFEDEATMQEFISDVAALGDDEIRVVTSGEKNAKAAMRTKANALDQVLETLDDLASNYGVGRLDYSGGSDEHWRLFPRYGNFSSKEDLEAFVDDAEGIDGVDRIDTMQDQGWNLWARIVLDHGYFNDQEEARGMNAKAAMRTKMGEALCSPARVETRGFGKRERQEILTLHEGLQTWVAPYRDQFGPAIEWPARARDALIMDEWDDVEQMYRDAAETLRGEQEHSNGMDADTAGEIADKYEEFADDLSEMTAEYKSAKGMRTKKFSKEQIQAAKTLVNDCIELLRQQGLDSAASKLSEYAHFWEWPNLSDELADVIEEVKDEADGDLLMLLQSAWDALPVDEDSENYEEDSAEVRTKDSAPIAGLVGDLESLAASAESSGHPVSDALWDAVDALDAYDLDEACSLLESAIATHDGDDESFVEAMRMTLAEIQRLPPMEASARVETKTDPDLSGLLDEAVDAAEAAGDTASVGLLQDLRRAADAGLWQEALDLAEQVSGAFDVGALIDALQAQVDGEIIDERRANVRTKGYGEYPWQVLLVPGDGFIYGQGRKAEAQTEGILAVVEAHGGDLWSSLHVGFEEESDARDFAEAVEDLTDKDGNEVFQEARVSQEIESLSADVETKSSAHDVEETLSCANAARDIGENAISGGRAVIDAAEDLMDILNGDLDYNAYEDATSAIGDLIDALNGVEVDPDYGVEEDPVAELQEELEIYGQRFEAMSEASAGSLTTKDFYSAVQRLRDAFERNRYARDNPTLDEAISALEHDTAGGETDYDPGVVEDDIAALRDAIDEYNSRDGFGANTMEDALDEIEALLGKSAGSLTEKKRGDPYKDFTSVLRKLSKGYNGIISATPVEMWDDAKANDPALYEALKEIEDVTNFMGDIGSVDAWAVEDVMAVVSELKGKLDAVEVEDSDLQAAIDAVVSNWEEVIPELEEAIEAIAEYENRSARVKTKSSVSPSLILNELLAFGDVPGATAENATACEELAASLEQSADDPVEWENASKDLLAMADQETANDAAEYLLDVASKCAEYSESLGEKSADLLETKAGSTDQDITDEWSNVVDSIVGIESGQEILSKLNELMQAEPLDMDAISEAISDAIIDAESYDDAGPIVAALRRFDDVVATWEHPEKSAELTTKSLDEDVQMLFDEMTESGAPSNALREIIEAMDPSDPEEVASLAEEAMDLSLPSRWHYLMEQVQRSAERAAGGKKSASLTTKSSSIGDFAQQALDRLQEVRDDEDFPVNQLVGKLSTLVAASETEGVDPAYAEEASSEISEFKYDVNDLELEDLLSQLIEALDERAATA